MPSVDELLAEEGFGDLEIPSAAKASETVDSRSLSVVEEDPETRATDDELAELFGHDVDAEQVVILELDEAGPLASPPGGKSAPSGSSDTMVQTARSGSCTWAARTRSYTYLGITRYRYMLRSEWCYNGTKITGTPFTFTNAQTWASWKQGSQSITRGWHGSGNTRVYRTYAQSGFSNILTGYSRHPWVHTTVRRNGTYTHSSGG